MRESFYATAATVIPVFFLAHAVLRSVAADLLMARWRGRYLLRGGILFAAIAACVLVPMAGEIAALMALTGYPGPYAMGVTWLALSWSAATFAAISIRELWKLCRVREERDRQAAILPVSAGKSPLEGVPGALKLSGAARLGGSRSKHPASPGPSMSRYQNSGSQSAAGTRRLQRGGQDRAPAWSVAWTHRRRAARSPRRCRCCGRAECGGRPARHAGGASWPASVAASRAAAHRWRWRRQFAANRRGLLMVSPPRPSGAERSVLALARFLRRAWGFLARVCAGRRPVPR